MFSLQTLKLIEFRTGDPEGVMHIYTIDATDGHTLDYCRFQAVLVLQVFNSPTNSFLVYFRNGISTTWGIYIGNYILFMFFF